MWAGGMFLQWPVGSALTPGYRLDPKKQEPALFMDVDPHWVFLPTKKTSVRKQSQSLFCTGPHVRWREERGVFIYLEVGRHQNPSFRKFPQRCPQGRSLQLTKDKIKTIIYFCRQVSIRSVGK